MRRFEWARRSAEYARKRDGLVRKSASSILALGERVDEEEVVPQVGDVSDASSLHREEYDGRCFGGIKVASESSRTILSGSSHCDSLNGSTPLMPRPTSGVCLARVRRAESETGCVSESTCFLKRFFRLSLGIFDLRLVDPVPLKRLVSESRLIFGLR